MSVNPHRGEVAVVLDGQRHVARLTLGALAALGADLGEDSLLGVIERLQAAHGPAAPLLAARLIARAALDRRESRGGHFRADHPKTAAEARHSRIRLQQPQVLAAE